MAKPKAPLRGWVDEIVKQALKRKRSRFLVTDWKTPSGKVHVGALRGVVIHDAVAKALAKHKSATFQYGFDDYDPMDGIPIYLDANKYRQHFGKPLSEIPSPEPGYKSFGEYYAKDFLKAIYAVESNPKIEWSSQLYKSGKFNDAIKTVLANAKKVNTIWQEISGSKREYLPIQMVCKQCGSIFHTRALKWDTKEVSYSCSNCKFQGKGSPFDGGAKLPWRVEWAAKWEIFGSDVEGAGKDHNTKGGSHDVAVAIAENIFKIDVPVNIVYEWFLIGGRKMSTSKGVGNIASDIIQTVPPELIRFLMESTRPERAINFDPAGDTIPRLFDEYDKTVKDFNFRFGKVAFLAQMPHINIEDQAKLEKGLSRASLAESRRVGGTKAGKPLTPSEKASLKQRIEYAKKWLATYASEDEKFEVQEKMPAVSLSADQKKFLQAVSEHLTKEKKWDGKVLHGAIHDIKNHTEINPKEAFQALYQVFLNKTHGPQAGWFLAALDKDFVLERLKQATDA